MATATVQTRAAQSQIELEFPVPMVRPRRLDDGCCHGEVLDSTIINVALPTMAGNPARPPPKSPGSPLATFFQRGLLPMTALTASRSPQPPCWLHRALSLPPPSCVRHQPPLTELVIWRLFRVREAALPSTAQANPATNIPANSRRWSRPSSSGIIVAPTSGPTSAMDHRQLHLELVLLHQRPLMASDRCSSGISARPRAVLTVPKSRPPVSVYWRSDLQPAICWKKATRTTGSRAR